MACSRAYWVRSDLTLKNRFVVEVPYVPGNDAVQLSESVLDSRMMSVSSIALL